MRFYNGFPGIRAFFASQFGKQLSCELIDSVRMCDLEQFYFNSVVSVLPNQEEPNRLEDD